MATLVEDRNAVAPVSPSKLAHIVLRTTNVDAMRDWYLDVLNAQVTLDAKSDTFHMCFIRYDDEHHRLAFVQHPRRPDALPGDGALEHIAFTYDTLSDLLDTHARLASKGIEPFWPIHHGATMSIYYLDPDGNRVELQIDTMSLEDAARYVETEDFLGNPIGVLFDPADVRRRLHAGEPLETLLVRPPLPEGATPADMAR